MKWELKTLNELGFVGRGKSRHRPRNAEHLYGGIYPLIQTGDIQKANFYITEYSQTYSEDGLAQSKLWNQGTMVISIVGANTAETAILGFDACFPDSVIGFIPEKHKTDVKFVKYNLEYLKSHLKSISEGTARENLSLEKLLSIKIPTPPLKTQQKISSILSGYDDLIVNNLKRIKLLEEKAQLHYKELMQEMSYSKTKREEYIKDCLAFYIGGGWGEEDYKEEFSEPAYVIRGTDLADVRKGDISNVPFRYHKKSNLSSRRIISGDIIFEVSGGGKGRGQPVGRNMLVTEKVLSSFDNPIICASFCKLVRCNEKITPELLYLYFAESYKNGVLEQYEKHSASNIVNFGFEELISEQKVTIPSEKNLNVFTDLIKPIFNLISVLGLQNAKLLEARDIQLPRLMNGEIEV